MTSKIKKKIFLAGHNGMVGSAILRNLSKLSNIDIHIRKRSELDLLNQTQLSNFFKSHKFDEVYIAAAKVGGIWANSKYPAEFIYENLMMEVNLIHQSFINDIKKILFLGSSCVYPKDNTQPISESSLLSGKLESTNEPYAIAKIAGIKMCESYNRQYGVDYRSIMPTNLYGPNDNFHKENSHVIPALIRKFHDAKTIKSKEIIIWGTGNAKREFLYVDDMAKATIHFMNMSKKQLETKISPMLSHVNVGAGKDISIKDLASLISKVVGYKGKIVYDPSKPDGTLRKRLDTTIIESFGWKPNRLPLTYTRCLFIIILIF